ncbi:hypothetical protein CVCC1112_3745 [Paenarthrobacter nicotinovorans]|nr:hypothetical protein CVCC1112_3745 [Paenarthrobacter nicotinovorans]
MGPAKGAEHRLGARVVGTGPTNRAMEHRFGESCEQAT